MNFDLSTLDRLVTDKKSSESKSTKFAPRAGVRAVRRAPGAGLGREGYALDVSCGAIGSELPSSSHGEIFAYSVAS